MLLWDVASPTRFEDASGDCMGVGGDIVCGVDFNAGASVELQPVRTAIITDDMHGNIRGCPISLWHWFKFIFAYSIYTVA